MIVNYTMNPFICYETHNDLKPNSTKQLSCNNIFHFALKVWKLSLAIIDFLFYFVHRNLSVLALFFICHTGLILLIGKYYDYHEDESKKYNGYVNLYVSNVI